LILRPVRSRRAWAARDPSAVIIVGIDARHVLLGIDGRVDDDHRDVLSCGALDDTYHRFAINRRQHDCVYTAVDHRIGNLELAGVIGFRGRSVPDDLHAVFYGGFGGASVDGLPENRGVPFRDNRDRRLTLALAREKKGWRCKQSQDGNGGFSHLFFHVAWT